VIVRSVPVSVPVTSVITDLSAIPSVWSIASDPAISQPACVIILVHLGDSVTIAPSCVRKRALDLGTDVFDLQATAS
jgi:hypothetical protein